MLNADEVLLDYVWLFIETVSLRPFFILSMALSYRNFRMVDELVACWR